MKTRKRPLIERLAKLLMCEPPRALFEVPGNGGRFVGYDLNVTLEYARGGYPRGVIVEEVPLLQLGDSVYLLVQDASKQYSLSPSASRRKFTNH